MLLTKDENDRAQYFDYELRVDGSDFAHVPVGEKHYVPWYGQLLSTLLVVIGTEDVLYSQTDYVDGEPAARFVLFTADLVVVVDVNDVNVDDADVSTRLIGRKTLEALDVAADQPVGTSGSLAYAWPGHLEVQATYPGLGDVLILKGDGASKIKSADQGPLFTLLAGLRSDLSS
ncbi:hypothetical protein ACNPNP_08835 [Microbacterium sp. AGC85]